MEEVLDCVNPATCEKAEMLFKCFCLCHDVIPMEIEGRAIFSGSSQDELVVLEMAKVSKFFSLESRSGTDITLRDN